MFLSMRAILAVALLLASTISTGAQERKVSAKLWQDVRSTGTVRIIVMFDLSQESLRNLSRKDQITAAKDMLLADLSGTKFRVNGWFQYVTGMGLSVDTKGLLIIEHSTLVDKVEEDLPHRVH